MPRTRPFTQSVVLGFLGQAITMLTGLWLSPFLLHRLGSVEYGLWIIGQQLLIYLSIVDLGVVALLPRETAYVIGRGNAASELPNLIARTLRILLFQTPVVFALAITLRFCLPRSWDGAIRNPIGLALASFCLLFPFRIFRAVLEGLQDLAFISWSSLVSWVAGLTVTVALVICGSRLSALPIGWAVSQAGSAIACLIRLLSRHPEAIPKSWPAASRNAARAQFHRSLWVSVGQIAQVLIYGTDATVVGRLFGASAVVPFNSTGKLIGVLANQPQLIMRAAEPGLSAMAVSAERERLAAVTGALRLAMLLASGLVTVLALAVNPGFVRWWIGGQYYAGPILTVLFALSMLLRHFNITSIYTLFAFGYERRLAITSLIDGVLSTIFSILLAWSLHSPVGVVLGSILSTICVLVFGNGRSLARELGVPLLELTSSLRGWFWRMLIVGWSACLTSTFFPQPGPVQIALIASAMTAAYAAIMFPVAMQSSLKPYLQPHVEFLRSFHLRSRPVAVAEEH